MWTWVAFWPLHTLPLHSPYVSTPVSQRNPHAPSCWLLENWQWDSPAHLSPVSELWRTPWPTNCQELNNKTQGFQLWGEQIGSDWRREVGDPGYFGQVKNVIWKEAACTRWSESPGIPMIFSSRGSCIPSFTCKASCWPRQLPRERSHPPPPTGDEGGEWAAVGAAPKWGCQQEATSWGPQSRSQARKGSLGCDWWGQGETPRLMTMEEKEFGG